MIRRHAAAAWSWVRDGWFARNERSAARTPTSPPTPNPQPLIPRRTAARGFTLVELLITVSIIAIMASMVLFAMYQAQDAARAQKTRTLIAKLDSIIMARYDEYRTRRVPYVFPPPPIRANFADEVAFRTALREYTRQVARARIDCLRDLMRMEMPDRWSDVINAPAAPFDFPTKLNRPSLSNVYLQKYDAAVAAGNPPSNEHQGAECLYMIVMAAVAQQGDSREVFKPGDIGDVDGDGFPEFLDGWGNPIRFLRWAPGYPSEMQQFGGITPSNVVPSGNTVELQFPANRFRANGDFVGGVIAVRPSGDRNFDAARMARITGYRNDGTIAIFTCTTPSGGGVPQPFNGDPPTQTTPVVFLHADPFDPRRIYPDFVTISTPTFMTIPLIYSAGPDRCYGVLSDFDPDLVYTGVRLNPCAVSGSDMIGMHGDFPNEPRFKPNGWLDNITNHQLNTR